MMDKAKTQIKVGIFVAVGLLLSMYVIFMIGGEEQLFRPQYRLVTSFEDISGLRVGAPIQLAGLKVGFVDAIKFPKELAKKEIELVLRIDKRFQDRIRKDSVAEVNTQGLLGDKFVYISVGNEDEPALNDGDRLEGRETTSIYSLAEKGGEILEDVRSASHSAKKFFEDMYASKENVRESLQSIRNIMKELEDGEGFLHAMIYDPKGKEVVGDIAASVQMLRDIIGRVEEADKKGEDVSGILENLRKATKDMKDIMARVSRGEGTIGGLVADPALYNDLRSLFGRANRNKLLKSVIRSTLNENDKKVLNE